MNENDKSLSRDPRIIPLVRSLKEEQIRAIKLLNTRGEDISSEKTSDNSPAIENENEDNLNNSKSQEASNNNNNNNKNVPKKPKSLNKIRISKSNIKYHQANKKGTKISIDAEAEPKTKSGTSEKNIRIPIKNNKIKIVSKNKETSITPSNLFRMNQKQLTQKVVNKNRSKYIQNLLNDISIRKYKQSCVDLLKNDKDLKKLYSECGFEKTNYSYENFIQNNFFNNQLFMFKLEILFLDESNFGKKNFKEVFFKNEITNYLNKIIDEQIYKEQVKHLVDVFKEGFEKINEFDFIHD